MNAAFFTNVFNSVIGAPLYWFKSIFDAVPLAYGFLMAAFIVVLLVSIFLVPLRGSRLFSFGSDKARRSNSSGTKEE